VVAAAKRIGAGLGRLRRLLVALGLASLLSLALVPEGNLADRLALIAFLSVGFATAMGWFELVAQGRPGHTANERADGRNGRAWFLVTLGVALTATLAVQTWFKPGTSIAGGDIKPPEGTAWLARLFEPWTWTGSNLGEPSQLPLDVPWAAILWVVHGLGGDPALAQRIWYTTLFVGAALGALALLAALRLGPAAALVGSVVYVLNPYVVSTVNTYAVYLAAMILLAAMPAALVAAGTGRLSMLWAVSLLALAAPMLGYVFLNPPLVGLIVGATLATPLLVGWIDGREAGIRSLRALALAAPVLAAVSAYWIVPAIFHLVDFAGTQLVGLATWTWTEGRANLRNAFWLNTFWGWSFSEYYPYAPVYGKLPMLLAEFALPTIAFGALVLRMPGREHELSFRRHRQLRLVVATATVALIVMFLSTGTNPPGDTIFIRLYDLPFGWLLREPGRFLMLVALAYAVLSGVLVQALFEGQIVGRLVEATRQSRMYYTRAVVPVALAVSVVLGFPLYTGAVVPDARPNLPPVHVAVPSYWTEMARFADDLPVQGALLVMPPDDFYQMPYSWGYYGTDDFIVDLFRRPVLVPNGQGYIPASSQVFGAVNLAAQSIMHGDWRQVEVQVRALNTPLILVRRDVDSGFPGRSILAPDALAEALSAAPNFVLIKQIGSLALFSLIGNTSETEVTTNFVTINTRTPDLRLLTVLPATSMLVTSGARAGATNVIQAPPIEIWPEDRGSLVWQPASPPGRAYRIAELNSRKVVVLDRSSAMTTDVSSARVVYTPDGSRNLVTVSISGRPAISNGDFRTGPWTAISDCYNSDPAQAKLSATVVVNGAPGGLPALRLSASSDSACEIQRLAWTKGSLVVSLMIHHVQGIAPRICLWEYGPNHCAPLPSIPDQAGWATYRTSVTPDVGTTEIRLHLYADGGAPGSLTVNEYADVRVVEVPSLPSLTLISEPALQSPPATQLVVLHNSYSAAWHGPMGDEHVLVDGMLNGWLQPAGTHRFSASYEPGELLSVSQWISLGTFLLILLSPACLMAVRTVISRRSGRPR
jgi:arabinofuranan 3-O-arabinosyltransferase